MLSKLQNISCNEDIKNSFVKIKKKHKPHIGISLFFNEYITKNIVLKKYKLNELKQIAKSNKLHISGTKTIIIERIQSFFNKCIKCVKIQKLYRGFIVRQSFKLRGEECKNRELCINTSDFYSMEPLNEIPIEYLFTFKSNDNKIIFGCNIFSFLQFIQNKTDIKNPYNREYINIDIIQRFLKLYNLVKILFVIPEDTPEINTKSIMMIQNNQNNYNRNINRPALQNDLVVSNEIIMDRRNKLINMRTKPLLLRIQELFIEIDQLGNYTNYQWFVNLERRDYIRLYRTLYDIWTYRGHLSIDMKSKICIFEDPFHEMQRERLYFHDASIDILRELCLKAFENMVYCGIDNEYRKIGTLHALSALTVVSINARNEMMWLYESLYP